MMQNKTKPQWFLAERNIAPDSSIVLGKLISDPRTPADSPVFETLPIESQITELNYPYSRRDARGKGGNVGVFLHFLSMLGVGGDVEGSIQRDYITDYEVDRLQTLTFQPNSAYVQRMLELPANTAELERCNRRKRFGTQPLYVITGIQIAWGGVIKTSSSQAWSGDVSVGVSPNVPGLDIGVRTGLNRSTGQSDSVGKHDFVYAFKLNRVAYSRKQKAIAGLERYGKGAAFSYDASDGTTRLDDARGNSNDAEGGARGEGTDQNGDSTSSRGFEVTGVQSRDAGTNDFGVQGVEVGEDEEDGNESCIVIDPSEIMDQSSESDEEDSDQ